MKISFLSDLHREHTSTSAINALTEEVKKDEPDVVVILGDLGSTPEVVQLCASEIDFRCPVAFVAGNHDIWASPPSYPSSLDLLNNFIPRLCATKDWTYLEEENLVIGDITIVGTLAWYDYSAAHPREMSEQTVRSFKARAHNDHKFVKMPFTDKQFSTFLREKFVSRLSQVKTDRIVVATHVPILEEQLIRDFSNLDDGKMQAMYGNLTLGDIVKKDNRVELVMSGHTHRGVFRDWAGVVPSTYGIPRHVTITMS